MVVVLYITAPATVANPTLSAVLSFGGSINLIPGEIASSIGSITGLPRPTEEKSTRHCNAVVPTPTPPSAAVLSNATIENCSSVFSSSLFVLRLIVPIPILPPSVMNTLDVSAGPITNLPGLTAKESDVEADPTANLSSTCKKFALTPGIKLVVSSIAEIIPTNNPEVVTPDVLVSTLVKAPTFNIPALNVLVTFTSP